MAVKMASLATRRRAVPPPVRSNEAAADAGSSGDDGRELSLRPDVGGRSSAAQPEADSHREDGTPEKRQKTAGAGEPSTSGSIHGQQVVGDVLTGAKPPCALLLTQLAQ